MKTRKRKLVTNKRKRNPLKLDPTRTLTLRRSFTKVIRKKFARLKGLIVKLVVDEDAFGLKGKPHTVGAVVNAFCPTGEGGGVDPSCSPGGAGSAESPIEAIPKDFDAAVRSGDVDAVRRVVEKLQPLPKATVAQIALTLRHHPELVSRATKQKLIKMITATGEGLAYSVTQTRLIGEMKELPIFAPAIGDVRKGIPGIRNAFCPTGEGGGVDPSCGSGGAAAAPTPSGILAKLKAPGKWMKDKTKQLYTALEGRYGKTAAIAIMASGQALAWGATGAGAVAGVPVWLPGSMLWGALPGAAIAETILQASRGVRALSGNELTVSAELTEADIQRLGAEFAEEVKRLAEQARRLFPDVKDEPVTNLTVNDRWRYQSNHEKIKSFQQWLRTQVLAELNGVTDAELWRRYTEAGFKKGAGRAFDDVKAKEKVLAQGQEKLDFYEGTKDEFLRSSFAQPVAVEKVKLLAGRSFDDLEGVTDAMSLRMSRTLTDGLVQGKGPRDVARDLVRELDISGQRAEMIARTELIRAHAEGQLTALENLGVEEVGVAVEWSTAGDDKVCDLCAELEGVVLKIDEARGMIPRHPLCRCSFIPANVGESSFGQQDTKEQIDAALRGDGEDDDWGPGRGISEDRPQSILNQLAEFSALLNGAKSDGR